MQYLYACDCGYSRTLVCRIKDIPSNVVCDKCDSFMYRDFKGEGATFQLKGGCWAQSGYGTSDRQMIQDSDNMCREMDKENRRKKND